MCGIKIKLVTTADQKPYEDTKEPYGSKIKLVTFNNPTLTLDNSTHNKVGNFAVKTEAAYPHTMRIKLI